MSRGCHAPGLVTGHPGLVTEQSHCRAPTWSLPSLDSVTVRLAGGHARLTIAADPNGLLLEEGVLK